MVPNSKLDSLMLMQTIRGMIFATNLKKYLRKDDRIASTERIIHYTDLTISSAYELLDQISDPNVRSSLMTRLPSLQAGNESMRGFLKTYRESPDL